MQHKAPLKQAALQEQSSSLSSQLYAGISLCYFMQGGVCLKDAALQAPMAFRFTRDNPSAPCRYRKRGVNDKGQVANDVETEQMLHAGQDRRTGMPLLSSAVQASSKAVMLVPCTHASTGRQSCLYHCVPNMQAAIWLWHCAHCPPGRPACSYQGPL